MTQAGTDAIKGAAMTDAGATLSGKAVSLHQQALVLDGLTPFYTLDEPYTASLLEGGVDAAEVVRGSGGGTLF